MTYQPKTPILIDGTICGTILRDNPSSKVLVVVGKTAEWIDRSRISQPGDHLTANEAPAITRAYAGIMGKRLEDRR